MKSLESLRSFWADYKREIIFFIVYFFVMLIPACFPLLESTEGRYAEIAREMLVNNNFLEPTLEGIKHFHKPPFAYWMMALGMKIFGINAFGARIGSLIFGMLGLFFFYILTGLFFSNKRDRFLTSLILCSSISFLIESRVVATDIYLFSAILGAQYFLFKRLFTIQELNSKRNISDSLFYGFFLGLGFLIKGPIILLFTVLPHLLLGLWQRKFWKVFNFKESLLIFLTFALIGLPWYILVSLKNHGLFSYFMGVQVYDRVFTNYFERKEPFYYFFMVFIGFFLPYSLVLIYSFFKTKEIFKSEVNTKFLYLFLIPQFIIFQVSESKLSSYLLPLFPVASIITYYVLSNDLLLKNSRSERFKELILKLIPIAGALIIIIYNSVFIYLFVESKHMSRYNETPLNKRAFRDVVEHLNELDPERNLEILIYHKNIPSVSFYRNKLSFTAFSSRPREIFFESKDSVGLKHYISKESDVKKFLEENKKFFLFISKRNFQKFLKANKELNCKVLGKKDRVMVSLCEKNH